MCVFKLEVGIGFAVQNASEHSFISCRLYIHDSYEEREKYVRFFLPSVHMCHTVYAHIVNIVHTYLQVFTHTQSIFPSSVREERTHIKLHTLTPTQISIHNHPFISIPISVSSLPHHHHTPGFYGHYQECSRIRM